MRGTLNFPREDETLGVQRDGAMLPSIVVPDATAEVKVAVKAPGTLPSMPVACPDITLQGSIGGRRECYNCGTKEKKE